MTLSKASCNENALPILHSPQTFKAWQYLHLGGLHLANGLLMVDSASPRQWRINNTGLEWAILGISTNDLCMHMALC